MALTGRGRVRIAQRRFSAETMSVYHCGVPLRLRFAKLSWRSHHVADCKTTLTQPSQRAAVSGTHPRPCGGEVLDALMHYVDFGLTTFVAPTGLPTVTAAVQRLAEGVFWGQAPCKETEDQSVIPSVTGFSACIVDGELIACVPDTDDGAGTSALHVLGTASLTLREAALLRADTLADCARTLTHHQVQPAYSVPSCSITVERLVWATHRHLSLLSFASRRDPSAPAIVFRLLTEHRPLAVLREAVQHCELVGDTPAWVSSPRTAEILLSKLLHEAMRRHADPRTAADTLANLSEVGDIVRGDAKRLVQSLTTDCSSPPVRASDDPVLQLEHHFSLDCPLLEATLGYVKTLCWRGEEEEVRAAADALLDALSATAMRLMHRERCFLADGDSTFAVSLEGEWDQDARSRRRLREGRPSQDYHAELTAVGLLDSRAWNHTLLRKKGLSYRRETLCPPQKIISAVDRDLIERYIPSIPSVGLDCGRHLTGVLRAADMLCSIFSSAKEDPVGAAVAEPGDTCSSGGGELFTLPDQFAHDLRVLRHLARVSVARRILTRAPQSLWGKPKTTDATDSPHAQHCEQMRAFPFLQELSRSLGTDTASSGISDGVVRRHRMPVELVFLRLSSEESMPAAPLGSAAENVRPPSTLPLIAAMAYLLPECSPQSAWVRAPDVASRHWMGNPADSGIHTLPCLFVSHPSSPPATLWPQGMVHQAAPHLKARGLRLPQQLGEVLVHLASQGLRSEKNSTAGGSVVVLRLTDDQCDGLWPLDQLSLNDVLSPHKMRSPSDGSSKARG